MAILPTVTQNISSNFIRGEFMPLPFYSNIWFYIACAIALFFIIVLIYYFVVKQFKDVIVGHVLIGGNFMTSDRFKKGTVNDTLPIQHSKIVNGKVVKYTIPYNIEKSCIIHTNWGDHLYYYFENIRPVKFDASHPMNVPLAVEKDFVTILESGLFDMIYRSSGFEKLMKLLAIVGIVVSIIILGVVISQYIIPHPASCSFDNQSLANFARACMSAIGRKA